MYIRADSIYGEEGGPFTREEFTDYLEYPLEQMFEQDYGAKASFRCYCDDGRTIETDCNINDCEFTVSVVVDFRKIKYPDNLGRYAYDIYRKIIEEYGYCVGQ